MPDALPDRHGERLVEFVQVMEQLRVECSWKREQTHRSLARHLLEEAHEVLEAIDTGDLEHLREELGDLLLQVYFHAIIAAESGVFTIDDVAGDIIEKMKRRNPHVFPPAGEERAQGGDAPELDPRSINELWESIKAQEKKRASVHDGIPPTLPALLYADKVLDRLQRQGSTPELAAPDPARTADADGPDIGRRLLGIVADARAAGVDPEQALRDAVRRLAE